MSNGSETADTIHNAGKVQLADTVRLMAENQQTLDTSRADDRRRRDLHARVEEVIAENRYAGLAPPVVPPVDDNEMNINIDSPTVNHHHAATKERAAPVERAGTSTLAKLALGAALLAGGGGIGATVPFAIDAMKPEAATAPVEDNDTTYQLRLVE